MIIQFAYTNEPGLEYDLPTAIIKRKATVFSMEVANTTAAGWISGTPLQTQLLDGQKWELPVKTRRKQSVQTLPNLVLAGTSIGGVFTTWKDLLQKWYYANARWIATDELDNDTTGTANFVKVVRGNEELTFEQLSNVSFAERASFDLETAGVY